MALYWLTRGIKDGAGRLAEDRGPNDPSVVYRDGSWKYGRGYMPPRSPFSLSTPPEGLRWSTCTQARNGGHFVRMESRRLAHGHLPD